MNAGLTRVYVPTTAGGLVALAAGTLPAPQAYAVTERLRSLLAIGSEDFAGVEDELAEAAVVAASDACLVLLTDEPDAPRLRIVVAADVVAHPGGPLDVHPAQVQCPAGDIPLAAVASVLADDPDDIAVRAAVIAAIAAQRHGSSADAENALDALDDHALAWFDSGEIADLVARIADD